MRSRNAVVEAFCFLSLQPHEHKTFTDETK
jgi:hypothetical protein